MEPLLTRELGIFGRYFLYKYCNVFILSKLEVKSLEDKKGLLPQRSDSHRYTGEGGKT